MRLDKFLAHNGFGSRKDCKKIIKDNLVLVNNEVEVNPGKIIDVKVDVINVDGFDINYKEQVYYMLNKPAGYICSHDDSLYPSALLLIEDLRTDLIMVGRLDVDTEGLLLITSDGKFSHQVSHGKKDILKQYYVELVKDFDLKYIKELEAGIMLGDDLLKPAKVEMLDEKSMLLSISQGKYHQVKRMMHYCDNEVLFLRREKIGNLSLDENLEVGEYKELSLKDLEAI
ncbi:MAG: rRNA pseudouridine synthase [Erysipelothrix sp.]|nr:rRNA pseudouridine synthase [Erysipelothrix sp.]